MQYIRIKKRAILSSFSPLCIIVLLSSYHVSEKAALYQELKMCTSHFFADCTNTGAWQASSYVSGRIATYYLGRSLVGIDDNPCESIVSHSIQLLGKEIPQICELTLCPVINGGF